MLLSEQITVLYITILKVYGMLLLKEKFITMESWRFFYCASILKHFKPTKNCTRCTNRTSVYSLGCARLLLKFIAKSIILIK